MQETVIKFANNTKDKWNAFEKSQKVKIIAIVLALITALALTLYISLKTEWVVVESHSDLPTISTIKTALDDAAIPNRLVENSSGIEVPAKFADQAMLNLAEKDIHATGFSYKDSLEVGNGVGVSETDKKEMYLRVKETEIATRLKMIDGVKEAAVNLVMPTDDNYFSSVTDEARASISLTTSKDISKEQGATMARLISMSVKGLDEKNISISDDKANTIYSGAISEYGQLSSQDEIETQKKLEIDTRVRAALISIYDDVKVIPNIKINWNKQNESSKTYAVPVDGETKGLIMKQDTSSESVVNGDSSQQPGVGANNNVAPNYAQGSTDKSTYDSSKDNSEYGYNVIERVIEDKGGAFVPDESSVAVFVYKDKQYNEKDLKAANVINKTMTWEQFKAQNADTKNITIDPALVQSLQTGTGIAKLTVVGFERPVFVDEVLKPLAIEQIVILSILALLLLLLAYGLIKKTKPDEIEEIEPELSVQDLLVSTQLEEQEEEQSDAEHLANIGSVESEFKKQIEKFVDEKPEAVAQLLRNWLSDEWEG